MPPEQLQERSSVSGQTGLTPLEQQEQDDAMSVALNNPLRRGKEYDHRDGWAVGRFVKLVHAEEDVRDSRFNAGKRFAECVDDDLVARGFKPRCYGRTSGLGEPLTQEELEDRRIKCAARLKNAEAAIREVDNLTVLIIHKLCHEDVDIPAGWHGRAISGLYKLALHFRFERAPFHA